MRTSTTAVWVIGFSWGKTTATVARSAVAPSGSRTNILGKRCRNSESSSCENRR